MAFGFPHISFIGHPVPIPCAGHAGLGFREAWPRDAAAVLAHFIDLEPEDRRMRFCATLTGEALERHVAGIWARDAMVLAAHDGPLWAGPLYHAGPVRALAELSIGAREAELGLSVQSDLRRRGVGTYLVQTAARLLKPRGVQTIRAYTLPGNASFLALARICGARIDSGPDEVEVTFDVEELNQAYLHRRLAGQVFYPGSRTQ